MFYSYLFIIYKYLFDNLQLGFKYFLLFREFLVYILFRQKSIMHPAKLQVSNMINVYIFVLAVLVCQTVSDSDHGDATINYNSETFDAALEDSKLFVMFYAPW